MFNLASEEEEFNQETGDAGEQRTFRKEQQGSRREPGGR